MEENHEKSSLFENLVMNFSIDTEELYKTEEKKLKSVPTRLEILAEGFASRWDLDQVNQKLEESGCEKSMREVFMKRV